MAKVDTDYFDPNKHKKPPARPAADVEPPVRETEDIEEPRRRPERPRRNPSKNARVNMRHSKLPDISRLLIMAAWMRDSPPPEIARARAFRTRLRDEVETLRVRLSESDLGPDDVRWEAP